MKNNVLLIGLNAEIFTESPLMRYLVYGCFLIFLLVSCSADQDEEPSAIDEAVKETADEMVKHIKEPIDKAEALKVIEEERTRKLDEQVQQ